MFLPNDIPVGEHVSNGKKPSGTGFLNAVTPKFAVTSCDSVERLEPEINIGKYFCQVGILNFPHDLPVTINSMFLLSKSNAIPITHL